MDFNGFCNGLLMTMVVVVVTCDDGFSFLFFRQYGDKLWLWWLWLGVVVAGCGCGRLQ